MVIITDKKNDSIVYIAVKADIVSNGIKVFDNSGFECILADSECFNIYKEVDAPNSVSAQAYKYTPSDGFVKDEGYQPYIPIEKKIEIIEDSTAEYMVDLDFRLSNIELGL
ncbi:hypothetical protein [Acetobacterium woodii]|uniref:Uncharacterized protein n=1 Tax=Acetobacterium woodii (strain ATCC 29683 / DSM 1030 / JCM 2381 / KCTC 1655 / WB1) TaxID=931626 RepID=H6LCA5_ACEWD|nr:hypothetical protein [Acetobacterium woodii]AFA50220.1 hypothetical protein Awo_c34960 [Acetobacterium woodii DSM 1030]